ncbi:MAG: hypothetical protein V5A84_01395, partial [Planctomycetota bacterium]
MNRRNQLNVMLWLLLALALPLTSALAGGGDAGVRVADSWEIGRTWSGCPLGAKLLTTRGRQYIA